MKKIIASDRIIIFLAVIFFLQLVVAKNVTAQDRQGCIENLNSGNIQCSDKASACRDACPGAQGVDLTAHSQCLKNCRSEYDICSDNVQAAYEVCLEKDKQTQDGSQQINLKGKNNNDGSPFNLFGVNPFETFLNLVSLSEAWAFLQTGAAEQFTETVILHSVGVKPMQEKEAEQMNLAEEIKFVEEAQARFSELSLEEKIKAGEIVEKWDRRMEAKDDPVIIQKDSTTLQLHPLNGQAGILEPGEAWPMLKGGAIDVIVEPKSGQQFQMQTPDLDLIVIGTKFSVAYDSKKHQTLVAVYEGKVDVQPKVGEKTTISPDGDKPGVVVVSQKLSPIKLIIAGVVLTVVVIAAALFLKNRQKPIKKK